MHTARILAALFKINMQQELAYRADTVANMLVSLMWLAWELTGLAIIFSNTTSIAGWTFGDLLALSGMWRLLNAFMQAVVFPNTEKFNRGIREGTLDYTLLQPANSQFMVSFSRVAIWNLWNVGLALATITVGLLISESRPSPLNVVVFLALTASGGMVIYSLWIVLIALTFWFTKFDNNVTLLSALADTGRFPATVYPIWLRVIVTFVIPIAIATTVPLQALRGDLPWWQIVLALSAGVLAFFLSSRLWQAGVKRYSGASA
ncbi:MAG: ABC transporter permease [Candidatus Brachytrichaceae bacterium NZ_4S206]|jgi:ABC-2 type transport system permease protein